MSDKDFSVIILCAERYALGRMTYIVEEVCNIIKQNLDKIDRNTLKVMKRDIESANDYGMDIDKADWMSVLAAINSKFKK